MTGPTPDDITRERARVTRIFQRYSPEQRAGRAASHRLGHRQRAALGEFFYHHPDLPGRAFPTRGAAAETAARLRTETDA